MSDLIERINLSSTNVVPGESVDVSVALQSTASGAAVWIDSLPGNTHVFQAPAKPGDWTISVTAQMPNGNTDVRTTSVTVRDVARTIPALVIEHEPFRPYGVVFRLRSVKFLEGTQFAWVTGKITGITEVPVWSVDLANDVDDSRPTTVIPIDVEILHPEGTTTSVRRSLVLWSQYQIIRSTGLIAPPILTSGVATRRPKTVDGNVVDMGDYRGDVRIRNPEPVELAFTSVRLRWLLPDLVSQPVSAPRPIDIRVPAGSIESISIALTGTPKPAGATGCIAILEGSAGDMPALAEIAFDLKTLEPFKIFELPPRYVKPRPRYIDDWLKGILERQHPELLDRGQTTLVGAWVVDRILQGTTDMMVPMSVALEQNVHLKQIPATQRRTGAPLRRSDFGAIKRAMRLNPTGTKRSLDHSAISSELGKRLRTLRFKQISALSPRVALSDFKTHDGERMNFDFRELFTDQAGVLRPRSNKFNVGDPCDPENLPADAPAGMACQFAGAYDDVMLPHRVMNAEKGDLFLSPGGSGVIGRLLREVIPPQRYAHSGIFTKSTIEVSHCTAAEEWLAQQHSGGVWKPPFFEITPAPSDGFDPNALKYIWPGGITQTVEQAILKSGFKGPDGNNYDLEAFGPDAGFANIDGEWEVIPPVLVKPHPAEYTAEIRAKLGEVADRAREFCVTGEQMAAGNQSKLHYRFYVYTDATIDIPAPPEAGWGAGTLPSVCSQLIWRAAKKAKVTHFEGGVLEPEDISPGGQIDTATADGLYYYTKEERAKAANWLYNYYKDTVIKSLEEKMPIGAGATVWDFFSDISDDVSNQIVNTFAHDWSDTEAKDSERWKDEPREGRAVSPDNLMLWDSPKNGGLWGTTINMDYRPPAPYKRPRYVWRQTTGPGTLKVHVHHRGLPAIGAEFRVDGTSIKGNTDSNGNFELILDEGPYVFDFGLHIEGLGYTEARRVIDVLFNQTVEETIALQDPPESKRVVTVKGVGWIRDDESVEDDEAKEVGHLHTARIHPYHPEDEWTWTESVGGEVLVDLVFKVILQEFDHSVTIKVEGKLWEGTDEEREDLEMTKKWEWNILKGETKVDYVLLWNEDEDEPGDNFQVTLTMQNNVAP